MVENSKKNFCPECGGLYVDNFSCWEQLGLIIAWEGDYPELYAEHFKTVACYNLQHPAQFTDEAMDVLKNVFINHLDNGLSVEEIRRRVSRMTEGKTRVLKDKNKRLPVLRTWRMTISDVYIPDNPEGAAERVRKWARTIREEL